MKVVKLIAVAAIVLALLLAVLVVALNLIPFEYYKSGLERQVKQITGREIAVGADSEISIGLRPRVLLKQVRLENAAWGSQPDMLKIGQAELRIGLIPLLRGRVEILDLVVKDLDLVAEVNDEHQSNWDLAGQGTVPATTSGVDDSSTRRMLIVMRHVLVENAGIVVRTAVKEPAHQIQVERLLVEQRDGQLQAWDLVGHINDLPVEAKGTTSYIHELLGTGNFKNDLQGSLGDIGFTLKGGLGMEQGVRHADQQASLKAPKLDVFSKLAGTELPALGPLQLSARISGKGQSHHIDLQGRLAELELSLKGGIGKALDGRQIKLEYAAKAPNLEAVSKLAGIEVPEVGPVSLSGRLSDQDDAYLLQLTALAAETKLSLEGQVARALDGSGVDVDLRLEAPDLTQIGRLADADLPPAGPVSLQAQIANSAGGYKASGLVLKVDNSDLSGDIAVDYQNEPARLNARLTSERLDLSVFGGAGGAESDGGNEIVQPEGKDTDQKSQHSEQSTDPGEQAVAQKNAEPEVDRVFSATPLPMEQLRQINADITYSAKQLVGQGLMLNDVQLAMKLENGSLELQPIEARVGDGKITGDLFLEATGKGSQAALAFNLQGENLLLGEFEQLKELMSGGPTQLSIKLSGAGESVREIMAGLSGEAVVEVGEAQMATNTLNLVGGGLVSSLFGALIPEKPEERASILECAVIRFVVDDGDARADKGIALQTEKSIIVGTGNIDLKTERIRISIKFQNRAAVGVDAGDITRVVGVGGTLAEPKPIVDPEGVAKTAGTIGAAIATFGVSYLVQQLAGSVIEDKHPCQTALGRAPEQGVQQDPEQEKQNKSEPAATGQEADAGQKAAVEPARKEPVLPPDY